MSYKINIKPLSVNQAYKGKKYRTDKYDSFIYNMMLLLPASIEIPNPDYIKLDIEFGFSSKASDIDNCIKSLQDCLVKKYNTFDDRQIYELRVVKKIVKKRQEYISFNIF